MSDKIDQAWDNTARKVETDVAADLAAGEIESEIDANRDVDAQPDPEVG
jgi:hypothetical protein